MKSVQTKIILLILTGIIASTTIVGVTGIMSFGKAIDEDSVKVMNLMCSEKAQELNNVLGKIEQSVEILSGYAVDNLESINRLSRDSEYLEEFTNDLEELGLTIANATDGAVAVYVRFNPDITSPKAGFFKVKNTENERFVDEKLTDFSLYSPDDVEHVGWYYIPVNEGKAVWMQPYDNKNIDIYMISYVIPVYKDDELFGIVGMDIDFNYIAEMVDKIKIYETGHAFITDENFVIVHSRHYSQGTVVRELSDSLLVAGDDDLLSMDTLYDHELDGEEKKVVFRSLENGMNLAVTVPVSEIDRTKNRLIIQIIIMACFIILVFIFAALAIAKTIVKPLKELNLAAKEIAQGNLEVSLACKSKDEVGTLAESLKETAHQLKIRIDYINNLAYMDKLTETKNNTAYLHEVSDIKKNIQDKECAFAVFVIDVNGLKSINDTYGHSYGNELIIAISKAAVAVFGAEHVFRIGGDEFAVILWDTDGKKCSELSEAFERNLKDYTGNLKPSAAIGSAVYDKNIDSSYESVFERADEKMYERKVDMKSRGENSSVSVPGETV
ncbi:MAG: diguanylate cyclase [Thermoflexaceae bacterium]|nr:diguanylate cyclase [Thermoflexaceae bacterium]